MILSELSMVTLACAILAVSFIEMTRKPRHEAREARHSTSNLLEKARRNHNEIFSFYILERVILND
jgi:hypothetical protein